MILGTLLYLSYEFQFRISLIFNNKICIVIQVIAPQLGVGRAELAEM